MQLDTHHYIFSEIRILIYIYVLLLNNFPCPNFVVLLQTNHSHLTIHFLVQLYMHQNIFYKIHLLTYIYVLLLNNFSCPNFVFLLQKYNRLTIHFLMQHYMHHHIFLKILFLTYTSLLLPSKYHNSIYFLPFYEIFFCKGTNYSNNGKIILAFLTLFFSVFFLPL